MKKIVFLLLILFTFQITFASPFDYNSFFFNYTYNITSNFKSLNDLVSKVSFGNFFKSTANPTNTSTSNDQTQDPNTLQINGDASNFGASINNNFSDNSTSQNQDAIKIISSSDSEYNSPVNNLLDKTVPELKTINAKIADLIPPSPLDSNVPAPTVSDTCNVNTGVDANKCKQDLFVGCGEALFQNAQMAPECKDFPATDYQKYLNVKQQQVNNSNTVTTQAPISTPINTSVGQITPSTYNPSAYDQANTIQSDTINYDRTPMTYQQEVEQRDLVEPQTGENFNLSNTNTTADAKFDGWVSGFGTLFATKGGAREAGMVMNKFTAFGYNPYDPKTCLVSLPYKTVDKFFGTTLDKCVKSHDGKCIAAIKKQVKDRAIEVVMNKNGKRGLFPLGELGPAEWTGNAIDFTRCAANILGATGKDMVTFRPAPAGNTVTKN